jgi:tetratricopeptide (TPR) repeat protein
LIAKETLAAISKDGARVEMYPLEISALAVAALRSVDVAASLAEIHRFEGQRAPLDASGRLGYYGVALPAEAGKAQRVLDVYGGRSLAVKAGDFSVLSDEQAMAAALALRGLHRLANLADSAGAVNDADAAVKLAPGSATVRSARAALLIASGGTDEGSRELEAAAQLRADAPRRNNLAVVALAKGEMDVAAKQVALALADAPDFANAHLTLASVHLAQGDRDLARSELEKAENLDPNLAATAMAWAELYAVTGDVDQAVAKAQLAVRLRPSTPETHLVLARVYRRASRFDEMRVEAHKVLDIAAPADKERIRQLLLQMLGPTALEEPTSPEPSADDSALKLSPQSGTGLQLGASEPKLHLGGSSGEGKLKLNLQP